MSKELKIGCELKTCCGSRSNSSSSQPGDPAAVAHNNINMSYLKINNNELAIRQQLNEYLVFVKLYPPPVIMRCNIMLCRTYYAYTPAAADLRVPARTLVRRTTMRGVYNVPGPRAFGPWVAAAAQWYGVLDARARLYHTRAYRVIQHFVATAILSENHSKRKRKTHCARAFWRRRVESDLQISYLSSTTLEGRSWGSTFGNQMKRYAFFFNRRNAKIFFKYVLMVERHRSIQNDTYV